MNKVYYALVLLMLGGSPVLGAIATFDPPHVDNVLPGTDVLFSITVGVESLSGFNWADVIIGIEDSNAGITFQYSGAWNAAFANVSSITYDSGFYLHDAYAGGNNPTSVGTSLLLGIVTIDTTNLLEGTYEVVIDGSFDSISALGLDAETEVLAGSGTFTVVPEPAALSLLALGGLFLLRSRRR